MSMGCFTASLEPIFCVPRVFTAHSSDTSIRRPKLRARIGDTRHIRRACSFYGNPLRHTGNKESTGYGYRHLTAVSARTAVPPPLKKVVKEETSLAKEEPELVNLDPDFYRTGYVRAVRCYGVEFKEGDGGAGTGGGVGVYSAKDIPLLTRPRMVMEIPLEVLISTSLEAPWVFYPDFLPMGHPLFEVINSTDAETDGDLRLACMMLLGVEQEDNFWHFYSDYLPPPDDCPSLLLASEAELAELQDEYLTQFVTAQIQRADAFWEKHWTHPEVSRQLRRVCGSSSQFRWALFQSLCRRRTLHLVMSGLRVDCHVIVPYLDMMNHSYRATCAARWRKTDNMVEVVILPGQEIKAGQELTVSYADEQPNDALMLTYGFSLSQNEWEGVAFSGTAKIHRPSFLSAFGLVGTYDSYTANGPTPDRQLEATVIAAARTLPMWEEGDYPALPSQEKGAAEALTEECVALLGKFPTRLKEDEEIILREGEGKSERWRAIMKYRMDRKRFLMQLMKLLAFYVNTFVF